jgi:Family of unknown function (DUF6600)
MKKLALLLLLTLTALVPVRSEVSVSLNFFVDALDPYGSWVDVEDYGYCWRPAVADEDPDWRPYTRGYWAYTDGGWTWISEEDWGWATYHYGRWIRVHSRWCWVPGYEWAPAWVSWRETDDSLGWAPLPPEARWNFRTGFSSWTDGYYDVGPEAYCFVPRRHFGDRSVRTHFFDRRRSIDLFERSANITRIAHRENVVNNIFVGGPQVERIEREAGRPVERLRLRRDVSELEREWRGGAPGRSDRQRALSRIEGNELIVAAPWVEQETPVAPPKKVVERVGKDALDRGWRGLDPAERDRLRQSVRANADNERPRELPARPQPPRTSWAARGTPAAVAPADSEPTPARSGRRIDDAQPRNASESEARRPRRPDDGPVEPPAGIDSDRAQKPADGPPATPRPPKREDLSQTPSPRAAPAPDASSGRSKPAAAKDEPRRRRDKLDDGPKVNAPARSVAPHAPSQPASEEPRVNKKERPSSGPPPVASAPSQPQMAPTRSVERGQARKNPDQPKPANLARTQPQPPKLPAGKGPPPAAAKTKGGSSDDEEKKGKKR